MGALNLEDFAQRLLLLTESSTTWHQTYNVRLAVSLLADSCCLSWNDA